jgi:hypothetical protein
LVVVIEGDIILGKILIRQPGGPGEYLVGRFAAYVVVVVGVVLFRVSRSTKKV